ncbi:MAG: haloacid dehalogenase-like hydrolase [Anaerolineaceae bacterium]|nr:haloacid dehalogenase-like hydrolase [Anaerolineaceae bacterium]
MINSLHHPDIISPMIVISDMMGTLTTGSPILGLLDWIKVHQSKTQARWLLASMMPSYLLVKLGLIDPQPWGQGLMIKSLAWLKDMDEDKFAQACEWAVEHNLWRKRREDVITRLQEHVQHGAQVYIASSVVEPIAEAFARRIEVQAIGSPVETVDGRVRLVDGLVSSERKIKEVLQRLQVERVDYAYGDTFMDIPLLENAMHPVAVYPDQRLEKVAKERGWEILSHR